MKLKFLVYFIIFSPSFFALSVKSISSIETKDLNQHVKVQFKKQSIPTKNLIIELDQTGHSYNLSLYYSKKMIGVLEFKLNSKHERIHVSGLNNLSIEKNKNTYISGVGSSLIRSIQIICTRLQYKSVTLEVEPPRFGPMKKEELIRFYENMGFKKDSNSSDFMTWEAP